MADSLIIANTFELQGSVPSTLPQCPGAVFTLGEGFDFGSPQPLQDLVAENTLDGEHPTGFRSGNRTIVLPVVIRAPTRTILIAAREALLAAVDVQQWPLQWTRDGSGMPVKFDCYRNLPASPAYSIKGDKQGTTTVTLTFPAAPFGRSASPLTLNFASPAGGTTAPPAPVVLDVFGTVSATDWSRSSQHVLDSFSAKWTQGGFSLGPLWTRTFAATDISALAALSVYVGCGANFPGTFVNPVNVGFSLSDNGGHTVTFGGSYTLSTSNNANTPSWTLVTAAIPTAAAGFDFTHVTGYSITVATTPSGQFGFNTWLNHVAAVPLTTQSVAGARGATYNLNVIAGTARAPLSILAQQAPPGTSHWDFETGTQSWIANLATVAQSTVFSTTGTHALAVTAASAVSFWEARSPASVTPVTVGKAYTASFDVLTPTALSALRAQINWYTSGNALISSANGTAVATTAGQQQTLAVTGIAPATTAYAEVVAHEGAADANGTVFYVDNASIAVAFSNLILHRPGPLAPANFVPFLPVGNGSDPPDGREYVMPQPVAGINADFGGTVTGMLAALSFNTPAAARTVTVTIRQYEYAGGPAHVATPLVRTFTPSTDLQGNLVNMGEITLPVWPVPAENNAGFYTIGVLSSNPLDAYLDFMFLDTLGQSYILTSATAYPNYWFDEPAAPGPGGVPTDLGLILASPFVGDRSAALSVMDQCDAISGGPLYVNPGTGNTLFAWCDQGAPALLATLSPRFYIDRTS